MSDKNIYNNALPQLAANHEALSPLTFIERAAMVHPDRVAVIHSDAGISRTWAETYARCRQLASTLTQQGIGKGDTVAIMCPNLPEHFEAHFGVPMAGAVLNSINIRLDAAAVAFILEHGEAKVLITEREMSATVKEALELLENKPLVIDIDSDGQGSIGTAGKQATGD